MAFGEVGADYCSYNSHKSKLKRFELIWEYQNVQQSLLQSVVGHKQETSTSHNAPNGKSVEKWKVYDSMRIIKEEMKWSKNSDDRAQEWKSSDKHYVLYLTYYCFIINFNLNSQSNCT